MILSRTQFFAAIALLVIGPIISYKIIWLAKAEKTNGVMRFVGKTYAGQLSHEYSVLTFENAGDTIFFHSSDNVFLTPGEAVPVRFQPNNPSDAHIDSFGELWGSTLVITIIPAIIIGIIFLHPEGVPKRSRIKLMHKRPFIQILQG